MNSWFSSAERWSALLAGATAVVALGACSAADEDEAAESAVPGTGGSAGSEEGLAPDELAFRTPTIEMAPGEALTIVVEVKPAGQYPVRFALLGNSADASLDQTSVVSDQDGTAQVVLTAPTKPSDATFTIRASVGQTVAAEAQVTVTSGGHATLEVVPKYSGQREIGSWSASAHLGVACAELTGTPPPDSDLAVESKASDPALSVDVPAGRDLAITVRSDFKVAGCLDVPPLAVNEARTVEVVTIDVPLQLQGVALGLRIDLGHLEPSWPELVEAKIERFEVALLAGSQDDVDALLDEMTAVAVTQDLNVSLDDARKNGGWDGALASQYGNEESPTVIRAPLRSWYRAAANQTQKSAPLDAVIEPTADTNEEASLSPGTFCGLPATDMGFPETVTTTWLVKPNDQVLLGASFDWLPWIAFTRLAEQQAAIATGIPDVNMLAALETVVDCDATATNLRNRALSEMGGCDEECMVGVCESAVQNLWNRANNVVSTTAKLDLSVAATVTVDENARPTEFVGEWLATIDTGDVQAQTSGIAEGWTPEDDSATP